MNIYSTQRKHLQWTHRYAIVSVYLKHGKGGYSVNDRTTLPNSRGGSNGTESINGYCTAAYQAQGAWSRQGWGEIPYFCRGIRTVSEDSTNRQRREQVNTLASSPVAPRLTPGLFRKQASILCVALPVCHFTHTGQVVSTTIQCALYR
jgi:hypothetical protein